LVQITEIVMAQDGPGYADDGWVVGIFSRETSPPRLLLGISQHEDEMHEVWVGLGDTFPIGGQTWRFEDIRFLGDPDHFLTTLRHVPPGAPPFTPPPPVGDRVWTPVPFHHPGPVDEARIAQLETEFGQKLPPLYRSWLAEHNGGIPAELAGIPGFFVLLDDNQPLLGLHPEAPHHDLRTGRFLGGEFFTDEYMVIAVAFNGLLAVKLTGPGADTIVGLDDQTRGYRNAYTLRGYAGPAEYICQELIRPLAPNIYSFEAYVQPAPPLPDLPPPTFVA
jgi:hypothetical protein